MGGRGPQERVQQLPSHNSQSSRRIPSTGLALGLEWQRRACELGTDICTGESREVEKSEARTLVAADKGVAPVQGRY